MRAAAPGPARGPRSAGQIVTLVRVRADARLPARARAGRSGRARRRRRGRPRRRRRGRALEGRGRGRRAPQRARPRRPRARRAGARRRNVRSTRATDRAPFSHCARRCATVRSGRGEDQPCPTPSRSRAPPENRSREASTPSRRIRTFRSACSSLPRRSRRRWARSTRSSAPGARSSRRTPRPRWRSVQTALGRASGAAAAASGGGRGARGGRRQRSAACTRWRARPRRRRPQPAPAGAAPGAAGPRRRLARRGPPRRRSSRPRPLAPRAPAQRPASAAPRQRARPGAGSAARAGDGRLGGHRGARARTARPTSTRASPATTSSTTAASSSRPTSSRRSASRCASRCRCPGGYEFEANAVVRWRREPSDAGNDAPPGFGAQFTEITPRRGSSSTATCATASRCFTTISERRARATTDAAACSSLASRLRSSRSLVVAPSRRVALRTRARAQRTIPKLLWKTLETAALPHQLLLDRGRSRRSTSPTLAEAIHARLVPAVGWAPSEKTEIVLTDQTDSANGSATALPYNAVRLYVTAPDDMSPLGDVDDWYLELVTHEYTHILHTDHIAGIPALVNAVLGKTLAPNQVQPRWLLEGSRSSRRARETSGGRLRSSMWNMWMRADVLEDNVATLDVFSNIAAALAAGQHLVPLRLVLHAVDRRDVRRAGDPRDDRRLRAAAHPLRRSTARSGARRGARTRSSTRRGSTRCSASFGAQADGDPRARAARGRARSPTRATPSSTRAGSRPTRGRSTPGDLLYYVDDGHTTAGLWALPLVRDARRARRRRARGRARAHDPHERRRARRRSCPTAPSSSARATCTTTSSSSTTSSSCPRTRRARRASRARACAGATAGARSIPSVSPDGRRVVFTTNHRGTTYLMMADVVPRRRRASTRSRTCGALVAERALRSGVHAALVARQPARRVQRRGSAGGYRDVRIVDTRDGSFVDVTHDRAIDGDPSFSPDGKWLYFHSDRTGVMNVYAYEVATGRLQAGHQRRQRRVPARALARRQVARVRRLHARGLRRLRDAARSESQWLDPLPYVETRPRRRPSRRPRP